MTAWMDATRTLVLSSPNYTPPQPDWPDRIELTGFTVWSGPSRARLDAAVETYLDDGPAPVLVTLGTSTATVAGPILRDAAAALDRIGQRGLFLVGTADNMRELDGREGVFEFAPLGQVLPRCRGVVHQGGHGTTAATLHAGLPAVAVPMGFDQIAHGRRLEQLGVGRMVRHTRHRVDDIAHALSEIANAGVVSRAKELCLTLADEDGITSTADAIEATI